MKIKIDIEHVLTLAAVQKVIQQIRDDGGSMQPFVFEITEKLQQIVLGRTSERGTLFGVPFITVDRIDKQKVKDSFSKHLSGAMRALPFMREPLYDFLKELGLTEDGKTD